MLAFTTLPYRHLTMLIEEFQKAVDDVNAKVAALDTEGARAKLLNACQIALKAGTNEFDQKLLDLEFECTALDVACYGSEQQIEEFAKLLADDTRRREAASAS